MWTSPVTLGLRCTWTAPVLVLLDASSEPATVNATKPAMRSCSNLGRITDGTAARASFFSARVEYAFALVSAPRSSGGRERDGQQRERQEYRGGDQQDDERHDEHSARVVEPAMEGQSFASCVRVAEHGHFDFGGARVP